MLDIAESTNRQNISNVLEETRRQMGELDRRIECLWELGGGRSSSLGESVSDEEVDLGFQPMYAVESEI